MIQVLTAEESDAMEAALREKLRVAIQNDGIYITNKKVPGRYPGTYWKNFFMLRRVTQQGEWLKAIECLLSLQMVRDGLTLSNVQFAGTETSAIPIVCALAMAHNTNSFIVKKERRDHGLFQWIDGKVDPTKKVVVVDDTIGAGTRLLHCIDVTWYEYRLDIYENVYGIVQGRHDPILAYPPAGRAFEIKALFTRPDFDYTFKEDKYWLPPDCDRTLNKRPEYK